MLELRTMSDGMGHRLTGRPLRQQYESRCDLMIRNGYFLCALHRLRISVAAPKRLRSSSHGGASRLTSRSVPRPSPRSIAMPHVRAAASYFKLVPETTSLCRSTCAGAPASVTSIARSRQKRGKRLSLTNHESIWYCDGGPQSQRTAMRLHRACQ